MKCIRHFFGFDETIPAACETKQFFTYRILVGIQKIGIKYESDHRRYVLSSIGPELLRAAVMTAKLIMKIMDSLSLGLATYHKARMMAGMLTFQMHRTIMSDEITDDDADFRYFNKKIVNTIIPIIPNELSMMGKKLPPPLERGLELFISVLTSLDRFVHDGTYWL